VAAPFQLMRDNPCLAVLRCPPLGSQDDATEEREGEDGRSEV
jgi:hypothetical protein